MDFGSSSIEISLNSKKTIIKSIGQIKGESISIRNNIDCIILIMDFSNSVYIQNCQNCSIFLAPCKTIISVQNCKNLNLISASFDLKIFKTKKSNFYSFVNNPPIIEASHQITFGNFFVQYTELPEMFINSKLNIWRNKWSCFKDFKDNSDIKYSNDGGKQKVIDIFSRVFPSCYINVDQYQFVPFTYGKSLEILDDFIDFLIILRQEDFQELEILKMLLPEELDNLKLKLISTLIVDDKKSLIQDLIKQLEEDKQNDMIINYLMRTNNINQGGTCSLQSSLGQMSSQFEKSMNSVTKSRLNEFDLSNESFTNINFKFLKKGDFLFLWFSTENNDLDEINAYFKSFFEPLYVGKIFKEQLNLDHINFRNKLMKMFELDK